MPLFRITYIDPDTQEQVTVRERYEDSPATEEIPGFTVAHKFISAREWAEDAAYSYADKGPFTVTQLKEG